ncbi:MAG TPA: PhnD/SsuA/transferrin family substrate-binding protein, partial [Candidatus Rifleibacterium sp.]|nr:PhnD/SsuA/transferrin family substrate-binding protein [Candidatus Rifleibacterium sp.]
MSRKKASAFLRMAVLLAFSALFVFSQLLADQEPSVIKIGVLKKESIGGWNYEWQETIEFLNREIPEHLFQIQLMGWHELREAVEDSDVDFVIASPIFNVEAGMAGNLTVLATLKRESEKIEAFDNLFGSVIFWRADDKNIKSLWDIRNKKLAAGPVQSIGGWLAAAREFAERGIDLRKACREVTHHADIEKIVDEVLSGQ